MKTLKIILISLKDNSKIVSIVILTAALSAFAVLAGLNTSKLQEQKLLNDSSLEFAQQINASMHDAQERLEAIAKNLSNHTSPEFTRLAQSTLLQQKALRIELRTESGLLNKFIEPQAAATALPKTLSPSMNLNFVRAIEEKKVFWSHVNSTQGREIIALIVPNDRLGAVIFYFDPKTWLLDGQHMQLPRNIGVSFYASHQDRLSDFTRIQPLDLRGLQAELVFNLRTTEQISLSSFAALLMFLSLAVVILMISYWMEVKRQRMQRDMLSKQEAVLNKQGQLSTLSEISTTLAHELNQPLATITNYIAACELRFNALGLKDEILSQSLTQARLQALRAGEVVQSLRNFLKKRPGVAAKVDLSEAISEIKPILLLSCKESRCELELRLKEGIYARIDPALFEQVVLNFVRNSIDAMSQVAEEKRKLSIEVNHFRSDNTTEWVRVDVKDNGEGISDNVAQQLFESFFTTKQSGMGVGLSLCRSVAESYGGRIRWYNNENFGATFSLILPKYQ